MLPEYHLRQPEMDVLDRPVWHALTGRQSAIAQGDAGALRFPSAYARFAAAEDSSVRSLAAVARLAKGGEVWMLDRAPPALPANLQIVRSGTYLQMVAVSLSPVSRRYEVVDLGDADVEDMLALADLAKPGPFYARTHKLGRFVGIRDGRRLVAMAGERLKPGAFTEISGVCVHPDYRGRGHAGFLMRFVSRRVLDEGDRPFLHCSIEKPDAIAAYRSLGFSDHQTVTLTVANATT